MVVRFNSGEHRTVIRRDGQTIVDGRQAFGTDGNVPTREISSIKLFIDRKEIEVSKRTYADCFEPNFANYLFNFHVSSDGKVAVIKMHGSDAAGAYTVQWLMKANGRHKRTIYQDF